MSIKRFELKQVGMLQPIFENKSMFLPSFGGAVQTSVTDNQAEATFLTLRDTSSKVVTQAYSTDENVAFGAGTSNTSRYGPRREIKASSVNVPYDAPLAVHEGIDRLTFDSPEFEDTIADRIAEITANWANEYDAAMSVALSEAASETLSGALTKDGVLSVFNAARKHFVVNKVSKNLIWRAYVKTDVYNMLVDSDLAKTYKGSTVDIDAGEIYKFKGFVIVDAGEDLENDAYFVADNVGVAGVAIEETRAGETMDYAGVVIVSVAKLGKYIPEANKKAIVVADFTAEAETPEA